MKKLLSLAVLFSLLLGACTQKNYVSNIPRQKFDYQQATPKATKVEVARTEAIAAANVAVDQPLMVSEFVPTTTNATPVATTEVAMASTKAVDAKSLRKSSFKQKVMQKIITAKINKANATAQSPKVAEGTNKLALIAGIAGIVSLVTLFIGSSALGLIGLLAALGAVVLGFVGKSQIKAGNGGGMGWALTGIIGGLLYFVLLLLAISLLAAAFGSFV